MTDSGDDARQDRKVEVEPDRRELIEAAVQHGIDEAIMATRQDQDQQILTLLGNAGIDPDEAGIHVHNWAPVLGTHVKIGDGWYCTVRCECGTEIVEVADTVHRG